MPVLSLKGYRFLKKSISLFLFLFFLIIPNLARPEEDLVSKMLEKARGLKLSSDRYWHILLHYQPYWLGFKSLIDDPNFFLSPTGKKDPEAELEATIKAFFESNEKGDSHPICRFIARYEWLKERLVIEESAFTDRGCKEFDTIKSTIQPKSAVLVFPSAFMNNPASMFGHTLIRFDSSYESKLLSYAANYAAFPDSMGLLYPIKGIFGFYKGYFTLFPYYDRIRLYNDTEQRDMWEYHLNFSEEEVMRMLMHLWELKDVYSYYYFFDENCSYNLLYLLEAARPSLHLTDRAGLWVIPVDTIRAVKESGIVDGVEYRPAKATKIRHIASLLDEDSRKKAIKITEQKLRPEHMSDIDTDKKIKILDLAIEGIQYKYNKQELSKKEYLGLFLPTLRERSKLGRPRIDPYKIPVPVQPEEGNFSSRLSLGLGVREGVAFQEIKYRPAYHSLTDPDHGYIEGSQIEFADITVRYYVDGRIQLESLDLIDIASISPRDPFFQPLSYKVRTGFAQKMDHSGNEHLIYELNPAVGLAFKNEAIGMYYALAEANLNVGGGLEDNYALGIGIQIGAIKKISDSWKIILSAESLAYEMGERFWENRVSGVQTLRLNQNNSLSLDISWLAVNNHELTEVKLNWNYYY